MIEFHAVHKTYRTRGREVAALQPVDLRIEAGEIFGLIGHSGAGKSTLLRLINRLEAPSGGRLQVDGAEVTTLGSTELRDFRRRIGMIFQHFNLLSSKTVAANVALPLELAGGRSRAQIVQRVEELLARVGLSDQARKYPAQLSGVRSSASASPAPWPPSRRSCSATRPPAPSIPRPPPRCCNCSPNSIASWV